MSVKCHDPYLFDRHNSSTLQFIDSVQSVYTPSVHGHVCLVMCVFGVATNVLHVLVLTNARMRHVAVHAVLTAIAICDAATMCSYLIYLLHFVFLIDVTPCSPLLAARLQLSTVPHLPNLPFSMSYSWMQFLRFHVTLSIAFHTASLWLAVGMAFIRLMTLKSGTLRSRWHAVSTAWAINCAVGVFVCVLLVPTVMVTQVGWLETDNTTCPDRHLVYYTIEIPTFASDNGCAVYKANLWLTGIMFKVIPCLLLLCLSVSLLRHLHTANQRRRRMMGATEQKGKASIQSALGNAELATKLATSRAPNQARRRQTAQDRTNLVLLVVLIVFVVTELPQGFVAILTAIFTTDVFTRLYIRLGDMLDLLSLINSSLNFILYAIMSSKYRQTFWLVLCPKAIHSSFTTLFTVQTTTIAEPTTAGAAVALSHKSRVTALLRTDSNQSVSSDGSLRHKLTNRLRAKMLSARHDARSTVLYRSSPTAKESTGQNGSSARAERPRSLYSAPSHSDMQLVRRHAPDKLPLRPADKHRQPPAWPDPQQQQPATFKLASAETSVSPESPLMVNEYTL